MTDQLTVAIVAAARQVPASALEAGARAVEAASRWSPTSSSDLVNAVPAAGYVTYLQTVGTAWQTIPHLPGAAIASAMRSAILAISEERAEDRISLVWTGPPSDEITLRSTRAILDDLIASSSTQLVLVSYASYGVTELAAALERASDRGVSVALILESRDEPHGNLKLAPALAAIRDKITLYRWPQDQRAAFFSPTASLHAKCVIADGTRALITSANLTDAAINDNMELGVLLDASPIAGRLQRHFEHLIREEILVVAE